MHALQICNGAILALNFVRLGPSIGFLLPIRALLYEYRWPISVTGVCLGLVGGRSIRDFPVWNKVALAVSGAAWIKFLIDSYKWRDETPLGQKRIFLNYFAFGHLVGLSIQFILPRRSSE